MLYIEKTDPPRTYVVKVAEIKSAPSWQKIQDGNTTAIRNQFDRLPKPDLRRTLLADQHYLCAYCMKRIQNEERHTSIEHWYPLSRDKERALSYDNFLVVCKGGEDVDGPRSRILCCDASKGDEAELMVNPFDRDMMKLIAYKKDGTIYCRDSSRFDTGKINQDINEVLRLNGRVNRRGIRVDTATGLLKGRKDAYEGVLDHLKRLDKKKQLTSANLRKDIRKIEQRAVYREFEGTTLFFLRRKLKELESRGI